jgi:radical SAM superfamily enzyme YgiQ (UPF0313 family)
MFSRRDKNQLSAILEDEVYLYPRGENGHFRVALVFPNAYSVGMSNLGFHILQGILNANENVYQERFFYQPGLRPPGRSLEKGIPLRDFDLVIASIPYELDYINLLKIMKSGGVTLHSAERGENIPIVIAGGVAPSANPEPLADFVDAFYIGEAEGIFPQVLDRIVKWRRLGQPRKQILLELSSFAGMYIPSLYKPVFRGGDLASFHPLTGGISEKIDRIFVKDLDKYPYHTRILTGNTELSRMILIELCRGCFRGCNFCLAGCGYLPFRARSLESIYSIMDEMEGHGKRFGLVATSVADYPHLKKLLAEMKHRELEVGISSFRADLMDAQTLQMLCELGTKTFTIAPEVGSEQTRLELGKQLTNQQIMDFVEVCNSIGVEAVKLYFMLGISADLQEELRQTKDLILEIFGKAKFQIVISLTPFVPKAHTPFALRSTFDAGAIKKEMGKIEKQLRKSGLYDLRLESGRLAETAKLLSLGDRRAGKYLERAVAHSSYPRVSSEFTATLPREGSFLPWQHINWLGKGVE